MSSVEQIRPGAPLRSVRLVSESAPAPTAAEIEARVRDAYQRGYTDASAHSNQQILEQRSEVGETCGRLFRSLEESIASAVAEVRSALPALTLKAVRRVLGRVEIGRDTIAAVINELLIEIGPDVGPIELRLNPTDLALVTDLEPQLARVHPGLRFVADESLSRGDCQAVTRFGKVDARVENKLQNLAASLAGRS